MPTVRRIERQVAQDPLRGGYKRASSSAIAEGAGVEEARAQKFGSIADFGERVTRFGASMLAQITDAEREATDKAALLEASNKLSDWKNQRIYNPNGGALTLKGQAAMPLPEDVRGEFNDVANGIESGLTTAKQKAAFAQLRSQEWQGLDLTIRRHVFGEMQAYRTQELEAHVDNSVNAAINAANDPKLVNVELTKAVSAIRDSGPSLGLGAEQIEAKVRGITSQTHVGVLEQLLAQDKDAAARAYFEATRDQIDGKQIAKVEKALDEGTLRGEAQRKTEEILAAGGTFKEQREAAKKIEDEKLQDAVLERLDHEETIRQRAQRESDENDQRKAFDIVDRTHDVSKIPPALWTSFDGNTRAGLHAYARARAKGEPIETNDPTYYGLMQQAGNDPAAFATVNLLQFRAKLDDSDFKQLVGLQLSIKNQDRNATEKTMTPFQTRQALVDDALTLHGIDPNAKADTPEGKAIAQLRRMVDKRVDFLQQDGKKADNQSIRAEIDDILSTTATIPGTAWAILRPFKYDWADSQKRLIDLTPEDITPAQRSEVEAWLRSHNQPISDATVLDRYIEAQLWLARRNRK